MLKKSPTFPGWARRVLLALCAAGSIAAAIGACGGENAVFPTFDMAGGGSDGGGGASDMGAASDLGQTSLSVTLSMPTPWASYVANTTDFEFLLDGNMAPQALEPFVQITPYPTGNALSGAFNWMSTGPQAYQLNFLPAALTDSTDYVVTVANPFGGTPLLKTGISIGSNPRVIHVALNVKKNAAAVGFVVTFSEPMMYGNPPTTTEGQIVLTANGTAVPATVAAQAGSDGQVFTLDVTSPHGLAMPLVLKVKAAATATANMPLNPVSWDSPTDDGSGNFFWKAPPTTSLDTLGADTTYDFVPTLN
jgi:hypothetical protein